MPLDKIGRVIVYVKDLPKARAFWEKKAGLKPRFADRAWVEYALGETSFAVHTLEKGTKRTTGRAGAGSAADIHFQTTNINKTYRELTSHGVRFIEKPIEMPYGWIARFKDPDGNVYSLFTPRFES